MVLIYSDKDTSFFIDTLFHFWQNYLHQYFGKNLGHVPAVLEIDEGRNGRILGDMPHPHLTGDVVQKGRTAAVDHIL